jgi:hypothetical protein
MTTETPPDWILLEAADQSEMLERNPARLRLLRGGDKVYRALCDMIEQHEAFKQEVSDTVESITNAAVDPTVWRKWASDRLSVFIIPKPKPDPLVEVIAECDDGSWETKAEYADKFRAALDARGLEIREKKP